MNEHHTTDSIIKRLQELADPVIAAHLQRFFKTGPGQYGDGDRFLGIRVPVIRNVAREFREIPVHGIEKLLASPWHEVRLCALVMLVDRFGRADDAGREDIYRLYMENRRFVNNWDLVDSSAPYIAGPWLADRDRSVLFDLARSDSLWDRRIAVMATFFFIRNRDFTDTLSLCELLLDDREDLIHKATGWMLREIGNRDRAAEQRFLDRHSRRMPRTMLRYAIEKFPELMRKKYLKRTP